MKSKAQRRWMWANEPEMAARWEKETPNGKRLPEKVKHAFVKGAADALDTYGLKNAAKECRLKIPRPTKDKFHGVDAAFRKENSKNAELAPETPLASDAPPPSGRPPLPGDEIPGGILPEGPPSMPTEGEEAAPEEGAGDIPIEKLTAVLQALPDPTPPAGDARQDPLSRDTSWGAPTDLSGGDAGGRVNNMGQNTQIGAAF